jgi:hypothetical protein
MPGFPSALLTVRRQVGAACDGLLVIDRAENLPAVDLREACYRRVELEAGALDVAGSVPACPIYVYEAVPLPTFSGREPRILQSYLDAVLQGFLAVHGEAGARRFVEETDGFETVLHLDRQEPLYPRAVRLSEVERLLFDGLVAAAAGPALDGSGGGSI